jgi:hypothetical protein
MTLTRLATLKAMNTRERDRWDMVRSENRRVINERSPTHDAPSYGEMMRTVTVPLATLLPIGSILMV